MLINFVKDFLRRKQEIRLLNEQLAEVHRMMELQAGRIWNVEIDFLLGVEEARIIRLLKEVI